MEAAYSVTLSTHVWARHCSDRLNPPVLFFKKELLAFFCFSYASVPARWCG
jgi:hypothetical protein